MPVGPVGNVIYANQVMHLQSVKQSDYQNRIEMQGVIAASMTKEKENEVEDVRPAEEAHKIDPEKEHQRETADQESDAMEEQARQEKHEQEEDEDEEKPLHVGLLDIKA